MVETFFGDWSIEVQSAVAAFSQRFTITGSVGSDGVYLGTPGNRINRVSGQGWRLTMQWDDTIGSGWQASAVKRSASFSITDGMILTLGADDNFPPLRDFDYNDMILVCKYLNPVVNPAPIPNPYDFTIPENIVVRRDVIR